MIMPLRKLGDEDDPKTAEYYPQLYTMPRYDTLGKFGSRAQSVSRRNSSLIDYPLHWHTLVSKPRAKNAMAS